MLSTLFLALSLLPLTLAASNAPIKGKVNPLGVSDAHPFVKRYCDGVPYSNTFCCGSLNYCFNGEECCSSYYCCPGGTSCLGGMMCSNGGDFTEIPSLASTEVPVPPITEAPPAVSTAVDVFYYDYTFTITW